MATMWRQRRSRGGGRGQQRCAGHLHFQSHDHGLVYHGLRRFRLDFLAISNNEQRGISAPLVPHRRHGGCGCAVRFLALGVPPHAKLQRIARRPTWSARGRTSSRPSRKMAWAKSPTSSGGTRYTAPARAENGAASGQWQDRSKSPASSEPSFTSRQPNDLTSELSTTNSI